MVDDHFMVVGLSPRDCCNSLRRLLKDSGRSISAAWYRRIKSRGRHEDLCRTDLFVRYT